MGILKYGLYVVIAVYIFIFIIIYNGFRTDSIERQDNNRIESSYGEVIEEDNVDKVDELISIGNFKLTAYCDCEICCNEWAKNRPDGIVYGAIGEPLKEGYSIAVDPEVIPYRTEVIINGNTYKAQDCGGGIKGNEIDIYMNRHEDAKNFGVKYAEVFIKK